jgi:hypothetical protein
MLQRERAQCIAPDQYFRFDNFCFDNLVDFCSATVLFPPQILGFVTSA